MSTPQGMSSPDATTLRSEIQGTISRLVHLLHLHHGETLPADTQTHVQALRAEGPDESPLAPFPVRGVQPAGPALTNNLQASSAVSADPEAGGSTSGSSTDSGSGSTAPSSPSTSDPAVSSSETPPTPETP